MKTYTADFSKQWKDFSEEHKRVRSEVENTVNSYMQTGKAQPVAIWGPIGQGKTQLLYHIFKYLWDHGGVAFYTTLEQLLPTKAMKAKEFAEFVTKTIEDALDKIKNNNPNNPFLPLEEMKNYALKNISNTSSPKIVVLLDEVEQAYQRLSQQVKTDDRSPLREWLEQIANGQAEHYTIAAFGPISFYESLAGEAERRRWKPLRMLPLPSFDLRKESPIFGNFIWWVSRGRVGIADKALDLIETLNINSNSSYKDFGDFAGSIGEIANVPCLNLSEIREWEQTKKYLLELFPHRNGRKISGAISKSYALPMEKFINTVKTSLIEEGWMGRNVEFFVHFLRLVIDALSNEEGIVLFPEVPEDMLSLLRITVDLCIEWESDEKTEVKEIINLIDDLEKDKKRFYLFFYQKLFQRIPKNREAFMLSYQKIAEFFPMPVTSPQFGTLSLKEALEKVQAIPSYYIADCKIPEKPGETFRFFVTSSKFEEFLKSQQIKSFLPSDKGITAILLKGSEEVKLTGIAEWLYNEGRTRYEYPPRLLSNFLINFLGWYISEKGGEYIENLLDTLENTRRGKSKEDKSLERKIGYYERVLRGYLKILPTLNKKTYSVSRSRDNITRLHTRQPKFLKDIIGFAFIDDKKDLDILFRLRKVLEKSETLRKLKSGIWGLFDRYIVVQYRAKPVKHSMFLKNIRLDMKEALPSLRALAVQNVAKDDFLQLSGDEHVKVVLEGLYQFATCTISPSELNEIRNDLKPLIISVEEIAKYRKEIVQELKLPIKESKSESNLDCLNSLLEIINSTGDAHEYTKYLIYKFIKVIIEDFKDGILHPDQNLDTSWEDKLDILEEYRSCLKTLTEEVTNETFDWIKVKRSIITGKIEEGYKEALDQLTNFDRKGVTWDSCDALQWDSYNSRLAKLTDEIKMIIEINKTFQEVVKIATEVNEKVKKETRGEKRNE